MAQKIRYTLYLLLLGALSYGQNCPDLLLPIDGSVNVPVESAIVWEEIQGVPGYFIALGSTPGADDILENSFVGSATSFSPPVGLPEDTLIFVTITLFFFNSDPIVCNSQSFITERITTPPECTSLQRPQNNDINVNVGSNITWNYAPKATSYILRVGTTPNGGELFPEQNVGNVLTYNPPVDFTENTEIFVEVTPVNAIGSATNCPTERFITSEIVLLPGCSRLISPVNGETNVPLTPFLQWEEVVDATGYRISIGTSPFENDILDNGLFRDTSTFVVDFEPNRTLFITIVPFNDAGNAIGCTTETFSTAIGCGPFINPDTGELVSLFPELDFPDTFAVCQNTLPMTLSTDATAEAFLWERTTQDGIVFEELSTTRDVVITQGGFYRLTAFNFADPLGNNIPCPVIQTFEVDVREGPTIDNVDVQVLGDFFQFTVNISGDGDFEYALNNANGPYQDSNVFTDVPLGDNTVFVRDKNDFSCVVSELVQEDILSNGFPNFFTPNGDGINDHWQFMIPESISENPILAIFIFDRFGKFLKQIDPSSIGWDGTFNGDQLPSSDYWYKAVGRGEIEILGHFTLKR